MKGFSRLRCLAVALSLAPAPVPAADYPRIEPPIEAALARIVDDVAGIQEDPNWQCRTYELVDRHLRDHFNWPLASRAILREHWPESAAAQERFVDAFYNYLVATFGDLLIQFTSDTIRVVRPDSAPEGPRATLETEVTFTDGTKYRADLIMRFSDDAWRIVDVVTDTYSHVTGYIDEYRFEIRDVGFDGLVERLEREAAPRRQCGR